MFMLCVVVVGLPVTRDLFANTLYGATFCTKSKNFFVVFCKRSQVIWVKRSKIPHLPLPLTLSTIPLLCVFALPITAKSILTILLLSCYRRWETQHHSHEIRQGRRLSSKSLRMQRKQIFSASPNTILKRFQNQCFSWRRSVPWMSPRISCIDLEKLDN